MTNLTHAQLINIARLTHVVNNSLKQANGEDLMPEWDFLGDEDQNANMASVVAILNGDVTTADQEHNRWAAQKRADGWTYGMVRNNAEKIHPMLVPFEELDPIQQAKDLVRFAIVREMVRQYAAKTARFPRPEEVQVVAKPSA
jgi:hypothetical protein